MGASWRSLEDLRAIQEFLAGRVRIMPLEGEPRRVVGVDVAYRGERAVVGLSVMEWGTLEVVEEHVVEAPVSFPYIPGYLSFREIPPILEAFGSLREWPDLVLVDGQGIAHPRGLGLASHLGVLLGLRTVGCAKRVLVGEGPEPGEERGSWTPLSYRGRVVGALVRTREGVKPVCVSPGHLIDLEGAIRVVLGASRGFRIPEPLRRAHHLSQLGKADPWGGGRPPRGAPRG